MPDEREPDDRDPDGRENRRAKVHGASHLHVHMTEKTAARRAVAAHLEAWTRGAQPSYQIR